ncbi:hypothetical protein [Streptomyces beigongshangae]|nr:hypothetical protein [Streptomyces sp. REN17]
MSLELLWGAVLGAALAPPMEWAFQVLSKRLRNRRSRAAAE